MALTGPTKRTDYGHKVASRGHTRVLWTLNMLNTARQQGSAESKHVHLDQPRGQRAEHNGVIVMRRYRENPESIGASERKYVSFLTSTLVRLFHWIRHYKHGSSLFIRATSWEIHRLQERRTPQTHFLFVFLEH